MADSSKLILSLNLKISILGAVALCRDIPTDQSTSIWRLFAIKIIESVKKFDFFFQQAHAPPPAWPVAAAGGGASER